MQPTKIPQMFTDISKEVAALKLLIDEVAQYFKSTAISSDDYQYAVWSGGYEGLSDCIRGLKFLY